MDYRQTDRKMDLLEANQVDMVFLVDFTYPFGSQSPQAFIENYIVGLKAQVAGSGLDYTFMVQKKRANMSTLPAHAAGRFQNY